MKKLSFLFFAFCLTCAQQVSAQTYTGRSTAQLTLEGKGQSYNYKSDAITFYLNMDSKTLNFYCKPYTFVMDESNSETKTLLINALTMNNDNAGVMEYKAQLPATFKMPAANKQVKVSLTGQVKVAGITQSLQVPVTVKADAKGNYSYNLDANLDLVNMGVKYTDEVAAKTNGMVRLQFDNVAIHQVNYSKK